MCYFCRGGLLHWHGRLVQMQGVDLKTERQRAQPPQYLIARGVIQDIVENAYSRLIGMLI